MENQDVCQAVYVAVGRVVWQLRDVHGAVALEAVEKRGEPPHPGLGLYLGGVAR